MPGLRVLRSICNYIWSRFPNVAILLDYKRGDIGATNIGYIKLAFELCDVDAVTINPYLGREANAGFLNFGRGVIGAVQDVESGLRRVPEQAGCPRRR